MSEIFFYAIIGVAGVLFHSLIKLNGLVKDAQVGNVSFHPWEDYWKRDAVSIIMSLLSVGVWLLLFGEVAERYPAIKGFTRTSFFVMGALGSWAIQLGLGGAKKYIRGIVDIKTNIADGKTE